MSPLEKLAAKIYFTFCSIFQLTPWEFKIRRGHCKVSVTKNKWTKICWVFNGTMDGLLVVRLCFFIYSSPNASVGLITLSYLVLAANMGSTLLYIIQALKGYEELAAIIQCCVDIDVQFEEHFKKCEQPKKWKIDVMGLCLCTFVPGMLFIAFCMSCYMALLEEENIFSFIDFQSNHKAVRVLVILIRFCFTYYLNMIFLAPMALYAIAAAIFAKMSNHWTNTMLIQPDIKPELTRRYMEFKITDDMINDHMHWATPLLVAMVFVIHVIVNFAILRLKDELGMPAYLMYPSLGLLLTGEEIVLLPTTAKMQTYSEEFLWKCQNHITPFNRKFGKAQKTINIALGNYGFIDIGFVVTFYSMLIDTTIDALMSIEE